MKRHKTFGDDTHVFMLNNESTKSILGIVGLSAVSFFAWAGVSGAYFGFGIAMISLLLHWKQDDFPLYWRQPITLLFLLMVFYVLLGECALRFLDPKNHHPFVTKKWVLVLVPWLGYLFYRIPRIVPYSFIFLAAGLLYKTIKTTGLNWQIFLDIINGKHVFMARAWGFYLSVVILGLIISIPRFIKYSNRWTYKLLPRVLYFVSLIWFAQCLVASQARTAWVTFTITATIALIVTTVLINKKHTDIKRLSMVLALALVVATSIFLAINFQTIKNRFSVDKDSIFKIISGNDNLTYSSATYRYQLYRYGYEQWLRSPVFGHGPVDSKEMMVNAENAMVRISPHFHSIYVEILVQFGALGMLLFFSAIYFLLRGFLISYFAGHIPGDYALIILCTFLMVFLWGIFNFRMLKSDWQFFWMILIGITHSMAMRQVGEGLPVMKSGQEKNTSYTATPLV